MSRPPYVRFYGNDWFTGCMGLKADERGVYISMCVFMWTTGRRVPLDDAEACRMMGLNFKNYQRVRDRLVVLDKVTKHADGYGNERAERELRAAEAGSAGSRGRVDSPTEGSQPEGTTPVAGIRSGTEESTAAKRAILTDPTIDNAIDPTIDHVIDRQKTQSFLRATKEPRTKNQENSVYVSGASANPNSDNQKPNSDMPEGFAPLGHGALINCETIRHPQFAISIAAVKMGLAITHPDVDARHVCSIAALQWAAALEAGQSRHTVVPGNITGAILGGVRMGKFREMEHETRTRKAEAAPAYSKSPAEMTAKEKRIAGSARTRQIILDMERQS